MLEYTLKLLKFLIHKQYSFVADTKLIKDWALYVANCDFMAQLTA